MTFSIKARTYTLKSDKLDNDCSSILQNGMKYIIPIFQRPYSWKENQISKLLSDLFISYWGVGGVKIEKEPIFIGTMQLSPKQSDNKEYQEVIDGQQRLTTFLLLIKALKLKFPECENVKNINFDWLETKVNLGKQQEDLVSVINIEGDLPKEKSQNVYLENLKIIYRLIDEQLNSVEFNCNDFTHHVLNNVYFVVIETQAGLSKTIQIFNAINTTGLDLDGADLFKIRMYEYLSKEGMGEESFDEISKLYAKIDAYNKALGRNVLSMGHILRIYQYILIARHGLPKVLHDFGTETFFEKLFDSMFKINYAAHFENNIEKVQLSLAEIESLIDVRYRWEAKWQEISIGTAEDVCSIYFLWWSRYSPYWVLIFIFLHKFKNQENCWEKMLQFTNQLAKLFIVYSVLFDKRITHIHAHFMRNVIDKLVNSDSADELIAMISAKLQTHRKSSDLEGRITEHLTENQRRKDIVCRLSAMIDENYLTSNQKEILSIGEKLFDNNQKILIDVEHIQSLHDFEEDKRIEIRNKWGHNINSIGNLMVLEREINRSIKNLPYPQKIVIETGYIKSNFQTVKSHLNNYPSVWDLKDCLERKESEKIKMFKYIFD